MKPAYHCYAVFLIARLVANHLLNDPVISIFFLSEEAAFQRVDFWSERQGEFLKPEYHVEPNDADED